MATHLAQANPWKVTNLACSGATIKAGLLGSQHVDGHTLGAQLDNPAVTHADMIVVNIGANDVSWSTTLRLCAATRSCANHAEHAYFQQQLAGFSRDLLQLLSHLQLLDNHPVVIVNTYYDPFTGDTGCLPAHIKLGDTTTDTLTSELTALNDTLAAGAKDAGFRTATPNFTGHGLCSDQPWIQGLTDTAPFHPTPSGEHAIAQADQHALHTRPR